MITIPTNFVCNNGAIEKRAVHSFVKRYLPKLKRSTNKILYGTPTPISTDRETIILNPACLVMAFHLGSGTRIIVGNAKNRVKAIRKVYLFKRFGHPNCTDKRVTPLTFRRMLKRITRETDIVFMMSGERKDYKRMWDKSNHMASVYVMTLTPPYWEVWKRGDTNESLPTSKV